MSLDRPTSTFAGEAAKEKVERDKNIHTARATALLRLMLIPLQIRQ